MLSAIEAIESAATVEELRQPLDNLCVACCATWVAITALPREDRLSSLMAFDGAWYDPACETGKRLVADRTGVALRPGQIHDRIREFNDPSVSYNMFDNPEPPQSKERKLVLAVESYGKYR